MHDSCGRQIDYMRISVTDLCNLRCKYCIPEKGVTLRRHEDILSFEDIRRIVKEAAALGVKKLRITGGEPLVRRGIVDLIALLSDVPGIVDIAMTTNGLLLPAYAENLKKAGLRRVNISLDSLNPEKYREITRGGELEQVLEGIRAARTAGLTPIRINTVLIGGFNDSEIEAFAELAQNEPIDVRFIELMPIGEAGTWFSQHFVSNETVLKRLPQLRPWGVPEAQSPARYYTLPGAMGRIGLINPISNHFCASCNRIRLTSDGKLKPCLNEDAEICLKEALLTEEGIREKVREAVRMKPEQHNLLGDGFRPVVRNMHQIGG